MMCEYSPAASMPRESPGWEESLRNQRSLDIPRDRRLSSPAMHWVDHATGRFLARTKMFAGGFGDVPALERMRDAAPSTAHDADARPRGSDEGPGGRVAVIAPTTIGVQINAYNASGSLTNDGVYFIVTGPR